MANTTQNLRKFIAPEIVFGENSIYMAAKYVLNYGGKNVLVVTDDGIINAGWANKVTTNLDEAGIRYTVFKKVTPNPRATEVMEGAEVFRENRCDLILAVGGGSVIDCAKGIGIVVSNNQHILEFEGVDRVVNPMPPMISIPTTAGTSADVSQFAIISNIAKKVKIAIISKSILPDIALIDPQTLLTMDSSLTAATGIDALVHAIEAYVSVGSSAITDLHAIKAIELITKNLNACLENPNDMKLRSEIMLGSMEAGLAFSNASLGAVHAMSHSLGGLLDLPHGECNAMLLPHVIGFNYSAVPEKYDVIASYLDLPTKGLSGKEKVNKIVRKILDFKVSTGLTDNLKEKGVTISDIKPLAENAIVDPCMVTNPKDPTTRDIEVIYEEAL